MWLFIYEANYKHLQEHVFASQQDLRSSQMLLTFYNKKTNEISWKSNQNSNIWLKIAKLVKSG